MIRTNKFTAKYNIANIDRDFDIFVVKKQTDKLDKTNILDLPVQSFKAKAVQYSFGRSAFVLFDKGVEEETKFRKAILETYTDVTVKKCDLFNERECEELFKYQYRLLALLLINSIRSPKLEDFAYNNLTGKMYYADPSWDYEDKTGRRVKYFLEITLDPGMYLNLDVKTFRTKSQTPNSRSYVIDKKTKQFRRKLKTDEYPEVEVYVLSSFKSKRNRVEYLNFESIEKFKLCKLIIMERFLRDVKKYLGDYLELTPTERTGECTYKEFKKEKEGITRDHYAAILAAHGVTISDTVCNSESKKLIAKLVHELSSYYGISAEIGPLNKKTLNFRIIRNDDYYENNDLPDPHDDDLRGYIVQHVTVDDCDLTEDKKRKEPSPVMKKLITEIILKRDVHAGSISIYDWKKLSANKSWTFVSRRIIKDEAILNDHSLQRMRKDYPKQYYCVEISTEGELKFHTFRDDDVFENDTDSKISFTFDQYSKAYFGSRKEVEGLVFTDIENIHVILRTKERTMPNTLALWDALLDTNKKRLVECDIVVNALKSYIVDYPDDAEYAKGIIDFIQSSNCLTKDDLNRKLNVRAKRGKRINRYIHEFFGYWINPETKNKAFDGFFQLNNLVDIKWYLDTNTEDKGFTSLYYYAGIDRKNLQLSVKNACIIRQVIAEKEIQFEELLPLLAVDFVRIGQYTVLPYPFKYLREYERML